jgi:hypothetical protein
VFKERFKLREKYQEGPNTGTDLGIRSGTAAIFQKVSTVSIKFRVGAKKRAHLRVKRHRHLHYDM